ncbi:hypothetical protein BDN72DRAFT_684787 [Pluteus cervinus]|uniref:Uncharacterized protein n=1 Tax=Pluteus cervinus TaxID=181527 RepID=A0ACD3AQR2_9AGAR|nr:hypothetical protein BDN72DRAFT_684787 [Pluteus cervinus]
MRSFCYPLLLRFAFFIVNMYLLPRLYLLSLLHHCSLPEFALRFSFFVFLNVFRFVVFLFGFWSNRCPHDRRLTGAFFSIDRSNIATMSTFIKLINPCCTNMHTICTSYAC